MSSPTSKVMLLESKVAFNTFISYLYIEALKLIRFRYFAINLFVLAILAALILGGFRETIYSDFQFYKMNIPEAKFEVFFYEKLSLRLNYLIFVTILSTTLLVLEIDHQSNFIFNGLRNVPVSRWTYLIAKAMCSSIVSAIMITMLLLTIVSFAPGAYSTESIQKLDTGSAITLWGMCLILILPVTLFVIALWFAASRKIILSFVSLNILYFFASKIPYLFPLTGLSDLDMVNPISISATGWVIMILILFLSWLFCLKQLMPNY
jgi:hypothetical protein